MKVLIALFAACLYADDAKAPEPQITPEQKLDYQRARADLNYAEAMRQQAETLRVAAQKAWTAAQLDNAKTCGDRGIVNDAKGDPQCGQKRQMTQGEP